MGLEGCEYGTVGEVWKERRQEVGKHQKFRFHSKFKYKHKRVLEKSSNLICVFEDLPSRSVKNDRMERQERKHGEPPHDCSWGVQHEDSTMLGFWNRF